MEKGKKMKAKKAQYQPSLVGPKVQEPLMSSSAAKQMPLLKEFTYKEFKKIANKLPLTQQEWSDILHISERTLQRYAKANSTFPFSVVDRILQIDKVIKRGVEVFGSLERFISWIRSNPFMIEGDLSLNSLRTIDGINLVLTQLGRIEHGLFA